MVHVPYKGGGPAVTAALGGEVQVMFVSIPPALQQVRAGKLKALGGDDAEAHAGGAGDSDGRRGARTFPITKSTPGIACSRRRRRPPRSSRGSSRRSRRSSQLPEIREKLLLQGCVGVELDRRRARQDRQGRTSEVDGGRQGGEDQGRLSNSGLRRRSRVADGLPGRRAQPVDPTHRRARARWLVARARAAQRAIDGYTQAQADELALAAAWAIMEPSRNRVARRARRARHRPRQRRRQDHQEPPEDARPDARPEGREDGRHHRRRPRAGHRPRSRGPSASSPRSRRRPIPARRRPTRSSMRWCAATPSILAPSPKGPFDRRAAGRLRSRRAARRSARPPTSCRSCPRR